MKRNPGGVLGKDRHSTLSYCLPLDCWRGVLDNLRGEGGVEDAAPPALFGEELVRLLACVVASHLLEGEDARSPVVDYTMVGT